MYTSTRSTAVSNEHVRNDEPCTGIEFNVAQISSDVRVASASVRKVGSAPAMYVGVDWRVVVVEEEVDVVLTAFGANAEALERRARMDAAAVIFMVVKFFKKRERERENNERLTQGNIY